MRVAVGGIEEWHAYQTTDRNYFSPMALDADHRDCVADESASSVVPSSDRLRVQVKTTRQSREEPDRIGTSDTPSITREFDIGAEARPEPIIRQDQY